MSLRAALAHEHIRRANISDSSSSRSFSRETESSALRQRPTARKGVPPPRVATSRILQEPLSRQRERSTTPGRVGSVASSRSSSSLRERQASPLPTQSNRARSRGESHSPIRQPPWRGSNPWTSSGPPNRSSSAPRLRIAVSPGASLSRSSSARRLRHEVLPGACLSRSSSAQRVRHDSNRRDLAMAETLIEHSSGKSLRSEVERLRLALDLANKNIEATLAEVSVTQLSLKDRKVHQELEALQTKEVLDMLTSENKRLQVGARNGWSSAWKLQAALRSHHEDVEIQSNELLVKQRRLEQENTRLRKEAAALRTRLLAWRQMKRRSTSPARKVTCARTKGPLVALAAEGSMLYSEGVAMGKLATSNDDSTEVDSPKSPLHAPRGESRSHFHLRLGLPLRANSHLEEPSCAAAWTDQASIASSSSSCHSPELAVPSRSIAGNSDVEQTPELAVQIRSMEGNIDAKKAPDLTVQIRSIESSNDAEQIPELAGQIRSFDGNSNAEQSPHEAATNQSQTWAKALSPAAKEAADVSAMVRMRATEALRGLGLRGESVSSRSCSIRSSPRSDRTPSEEACMPIVDVHLSCAE